jgi:small neutral amino acid transporter SnatA (MarC family)
MQPDPNQRRIAAQKAIRLGCAVIVAAIALLLIPLISRYIALQQINRYVVAFGLLGMCVGLSLILNGAVDWWRGR